MRPHTAFSLCMPYHNNSGMLDRHYEQIANLDPAYQRAFELVICDDASDEPATYPTSDIGVPVRIFRIPPPHIPWSHRVATNIAAAEAHGAWFVITDIDHIVSRRAWSHLTSGAVKPFLRTDVAYTFTRENLDGSEYKAHPDSWLIHCSLWSRICGYDERLRGLYGQNAPFQKRVAHHANVEQLTAPLIRVGREDVADASERVLARKTPEGRAAMAARLASITDPFKDTRGGQHYARVPAP